MKVTLTATEWVTIANLFDRAPAPMEARTRRVQDRLYDLLFDLRAELRDGEQSAEVERDLPTSYVHYLRAFLADRPARQYHQQGWRQFVRPLLVNKLGWVDEELDDADDE